MLKCVGMGGIELLMFVLGRVLVRGRKGSGKWTREKGKGIVLKY